MSLYWVRTEESAGSVPTLEEYTTLLRCPRIQGNKAYVRPASLLIFVRKLVMITGMSEQWAVARVQQKGDTTTTPRRDDITEERWMDILQNLQEEEVLWKAPWMTPNEVLYRCGSFDWVPLPGIWGVVGYVPLLVLRQYKAG
ncbi:hypothetical protein PVK06_040385 [Gossypium arboreum]|uniref:DUF7745 domain-containing protein n=1 Tax=Gossypium arboreum TaxID=29729 RepID=A0ABR0N592_GOSAR|nr:hypothetical protein PVK06_040385 [Gossypium arboreum]